jgi:hypothetical protein
MPRITGSSSIDWSGVPLTQVDFATDIVRFVNRVDQILAEVFLGQLPATTLPQTYRQRLAYTLPGGAAGL